MALDEEIAAMGAEVSAHRADVLVVDDEALFGKAVRRSLERAGFGCTHVTSLGAARAALGETEPDLILLDMRLPDGSGLDFLRELRADSPVPVIVMTAYGEVSDAVTAMKYAASDYLKKPLDLDELLLNVDKVLAASAVSQRLAYSQAREHHQSDGSRLLGESPGLVAVREQVERIAGLIGNEGLPPTVLITGETGCGKDVTARLLHQHSARAGRPFVHVDCAALPKDLIEAELFGHVKGAFTSAVGERTGLIEAAEDGVVFLDEIGEIPLELQAKLLAVLERRTLRRIGSSHERATRAWFVAATNRDVDEMVASGTLRSDLYFRLNVLTIELPPLRERGGDAALLARSFADELARRYGIDGCELTADAVAALTRYPWPGNVRELSHVIERAVLLAGNGVIDAATLALPGGTAAAPAGAGLAALDDMTLEEVEKLMIERALAATGGNVSEAARRLGITRMAMRYRVQKYGL
ncbi:MAG: sigma-54-dependent transcriptional regulator [Gammaproteobacteria bacterium]